MAQSSGRRCGEIEVKNKSRKPLTNITPSPKWKAASLVAAVVIFYLLYVAFITLTSKPRPPHSISPDYQEGEARGHRWLHYGAWQIADRSIFRSLWPLHIFNQSSSTIPPFSIESEKPAFVEVRPALILRCENDLLTVAIGIDNRNHPVNWWPSLPVSWTTHSSTNQEEWLLKATRDGGGIWYSPTPLVFFQSIRTANRLTFEMRPPTENPISVNFDLDGIEDVIRFVRRRCPSSLSE